MAKTFEEFVILKRTVLRYILARESKLLSLGKRPINKKISNYVKNNHHENVWSTINEDLTKNIYVYQLGTGEPDIEPLRENVLDITSKKTLVAYKMLRW